jgi:GT2 family glycosyltransferase
MTIGVAIVVGPGRSAGDLQRCLASIAAQTRLPDELLIVGDGAAPPALGLDLVVTTRLTLPVNGGWRVARNRAAERSESDLVVFLDDDGVLVSNAIEAIEAVALEMPLALGFAGCVVDPSDRSPQLAQPWQTVSFSGGAFATWRETFLALGGYDETRQAYGEEFDLSLRSLKLGCLVYRVPAFVLVHPRRSSRNVSDRELANLFNRTVTQAEQFPAPVAVAAVLWKLVTRGAVLARKREWAKLRRFVQELHRSASCGFRRRRSPLTWREYLRMRAIVRDDAGRIV